MSFLNILFSLIKTLQDDGPKVGISHNGCLSRMNWVYLAHCDFAWGAKLGLELNHEFCF